MESIIQAELALASASPSSSAPKPKIIGVPPSQGRGGNQTPRTQSSIFVSQPLPSPKSSGSLSSSYVAAGSADRWGLGMTRIETNGPMNSSPSSELDLVSLSISPKSAHPVSNGPSLLSQQAPSVGAKPVPIPSPHAGAMDVDSDDRYANGIADRITVKIADLGNGEFTHIHNPLCVNLRRQQRGHITTSRTISRLDNTALRRSSLVPNGARVPIYGVLPVLSACVHFLRA